MAAKGSRTALRSKITVKGSRELAQAMRGKKQDLIDGIDSDVEIVTLQAINEARAAAPYLHGELKRRIQLITQRTGVMTRVWGGFAEYTRRQEYEHKTKKGFLRRAQWNARKALRAAIEATLRRLGGRV